MSSGNSSKNPRRALSVCFVSPFAYGLLNPVSKIRFGGAEVDLVAIGTELAKDPEYRVCFVVADFGQPNRETRNGIEILKSFNPAHSGAHKLVYSAFKGVPKLLKTLQQADADIYFQEGAGVETAITAWFCQRRRRQFMYRVASTIECDGRLQRQWPFVAKCFRYGIRRAAKVITEDHDEAKLLMKNLGIVAHPIYDTTPIPNPGDIVPLQKRRHILWVGRMVHIKHPELVFDVASAFPAEQFVLVAPPEPTESRFGVAIRDQAKRFQNVQIIPGLSPAQLDPYFAQAKVFLNTSEYEGYPNTFIEAAKYGVPVLSLNVNPDTFLTRHGIGECAEGDLDRLRALIGRWINDSTRRALVIERGPAYTREHNDIQNNIQFYKFLMKKLPQR